MTATEVATRLARGDVSPMEVLEHTLQRIERLEPRLNAFLAVMGSEARAQARRLERIKNRGVLFGVPVSVKDIMLTRAALTTAGSKAYGKGLASDSDAQVVARLKRAGAVLVGKTNLHEAALGITSTNEHFGPVRNPWALDRVPGGSSGGSGAAVAAGLSYASLGTDTRGSVRIPAACCGVTGLKPTTGLVSTQGVLPLSWTLDHVGPLTRSVEDAALILGVIAGQRSNPRRYAEAVRRSPRGLRIGISEHHMRDLAPQVSKAVEGAMESLEASGARLSRITLPELDGALEASLVIGGSEAATHHEATLRDRPEGYGPKLRQRLQRGFGHTAVDLVQAQRKRLRVMEAFEEAFREVDVMAGATIPRPAVPIGTEHVTVTGQERSLTDEYMRLTAPQSMGTVPALSVPCGFTPDGLPIGMQLMAPRHREDVLFCLGAAYQRETDWHRRHPPIE